MLHFSHLRPFILKIPQPPGMSCAACSGGPFSCVHGNFMPLPPEWQCRIFILSVADLKIFVFRQPSAAAAQKSRKRGQSRYFYAGG
jgi:hypothetical protein